MRGKDGARGGDHGRPFFCVAQQRSDRVDYVLLVVHADCGARFAELCGERFEVAGMWADQHGSTGLQRFDHVLTPAINRAGKALADEHDRGSGIPGAQFSGGVEQQRILRKIGAFRTKAAWNFEFF